jgi:hypothetical protein
MSGLFHVVEERHEPHPVFRLWDRARSEAVNRDRLPIVLLIHTPDEAVWFV